jgi:erythrocyte band 7 integral membrane protein
VQKQQSEYINMDERGESSSVVTDTGGSGFCETVLTYLSMFLVLITLPISIWMVVKQVQEYERAIIFRLGRIKKGGAVGPGLFFIIPCIDNIRVVDLRVMSFDVPKQEILTKDSVTVAVDAVVYYHVQDPLATVCNVEDAGYSTRLLASTTLRNVLGTKSLADVLSDRDHTGATMLAQLDAATDPWGIKVDRVEVKDVRLPQQLQRAMAAEAEASREARAKVIQAEGEQKSARALKEASDIISESPAALQLRYLQTLTQISAEKNSTIIFPLPMELMTKFVQGDKDGHSEKM